MEPTEKEFSFAEHERHHEYEVADVAVLDFDRMLGDVTACVQRLHAAAESVGIDASVLKAAQAKTENDGASFQPLPYIKSRLSSEEYELFQRNFVYEPGPDVLYPDARRFLAMLHYADMPHVIMTYGDPEWQALKLMASGYPMGCMIMDTPDKGAHLQALSHPDPTTGEPRFAMEVARHGSATYRGSRLSFLDDKAVAFKSMPVNESYQGFWLHRGELLSVQKGNVPENVQIITSLDELTIDADGRLVVGDRNEMLTRDPLTDRHAVTDTLNAAPRNPYFTDNAVYVPVGAIPAESLFTHPSWSDVPIEAFEVAV